MLRPGFACSAQPVLPVFPSLNGGKVYCALRSRRFRDSTEQDPEHQAVLAHDYFIGSQSQTNFRLIKVLIKKKIPVHVVIY
jgi:hypothetical protein